MGKRIKLRDVRSVGAIRAMRLFRNKRAARFFCAGLILGMMSCLYLRAEEAKADFSEKVRLISPNLGLMFFGDEPVKVDVQLQGPLSRGTLDYTIQQLGGEWKTGGSLQVARVPRGGTRTEPLALSLPGPGLYRVHVQGALGSPKISFDRNVSVLTEPPPVDIDSPWGIFYVPPLWFDPKNPKGPEEAARNIRALGASWVRLGFWENSFGTVSVPEPDGKGHREVKMAISTWKDYARELHAQGIHILGTLGFVPRALSSKPESLITAGDGGAEYGRVKPANYELWEQFVEQVARTFKEEIEVWEIGNEPENHGQYFYGSIEEFIELVQHTNRGLRRGNPAIKTAGSGFTREGTALNWANRLFELGLAKEIDYLTVHYTDREAVYIDRWRTLLREKEVSPPIWNSEENSNVPLFDRIHGIPHSFKFLHVNIGYEEAGPLVEKDYSLRTAGMEYAVGARCLGSAQFLRSAIVPGGMLHLFQRGLEVVGVYQREPLATFLDGAHPAELHVRAVSLDPGSAPIITTSLGRVLQLNREENGEFVVSARESLVFINGCASLEPATVNFPRAYVVAEAEDGIFSPSWHPIEHRDASHQRLLELWTNDEGGKDGHFFEVKLDVPRDGTYDLLLASSPLSGLKTPRSISPFSWSIGDHAAIKVDAPPSVLASSETIEGGLNLLGKVELKAGTQVFRLAIVEKRETAPVYRLSVDAVVLRSAVLK